MNECPTVPIRLSHPPLEGERLRRQVTIVVEDDCDVTVEVVHRGSDQDELESGYRTISDVAYLVDESGCCLIDEDDCHD